MFGPHASGRIYIASLPNPENKGAEGEPDEHHILTRNSAQITDFVTHQDRPEKAASSASPRSRTRPRAAPRRPSIDRLPARRDRLARRKRRRKRSNASSSTCRCPPSPGTIRPRAAPLLVPRGRHPRHAREHCGARAAATPARRSPRRRSGRLPRCTSCCGCRARPIARTASTPGARTHRSPGSALRLQRAQELDRPAGAPLIRRKSTGRQRQSPDNPFLAFAAAYASEEPLDVDQMLADMVYLGPGGGGNAHDTLLALHRRHADARRET